MKPRLLDLFCGAGGAARGYQQAGFYVVGIDNRPQPRYAGDEFVQADALTFPLEGFDVIHASPPCQAYSRLAAMHRERDYPDLIAVTSTLLTAVNVPYVIENVEGAPLARHPQLNGIWGIFLCGSMFGLGVERGYLRRHRLFESNVALAQPQCRHRGPAVGVYGHGGYTGKHRMLYRAEAAQAMQTSWMTRDEMTQAIPPAYTKYIGGFLMSHLEGNRG